MNRKSNNPNCKKAAAIDVGTNSVKIAAGGVSEQGNFYSLVDEVVISRLGEGVDSTRNLSPIGMSRTVEAILSLLNLISGLNIDHIRIVATSAVRDAQNKDEFIKLVKEKCGLELEVLSEQDECRLSFAAVARDSEINFPDDKIAVIDIGGGSTELSLGTVHTLVFCRSLEIGAVRLTEKFIATDPPDQNEMKSAQEYVDCMLAEVIGGMSLSRIAGVGGTIVNLARISKKAQPENTSDIHGTIVTADNIHNLLTYLASLPLERKKTVPGLEPDRADIIVMGTLILSRVLSLLSARELVVSTKGLRYGMLYEMLGIEK